MGLRKDSLKTFVRISALKTSAVKITLENTGAVRKNPGRERLYFSYHVGGYSPDSPHDRSKRRICL